MGGYMKPEDIRQGLEELAVRVEIFAYLDEIEFEAYMGRKQMTQALFDSIANKISPIDTDKFIDFISEYAVFLHDEPDPKIKELDTMEWNPPDDLVADEQMLEKIKAGIALREEQNRQKIEEWERQKDIIRESCGIKK